MAPVSNDDEPDAGAAVQGSGEKAAPAAPANKDDPHQPKVDPFHNPDPTRQL